MLRGLVTAMRTLSVLPVPGREAGKFSDSLYWFPLVGLFLGGLQAAAAMLAAGFAWPELSAALVLLSGVVLTRGMHADGLADMADGFFGGRDREARLRIMKDPSVGSFGVLALVLLYLLKWVVLARLLAGEFWTVLIAGVVLARVAQVVLASLLPYARSGGGTASGFVSGAGAWHAAAALLTGAGLVVLLTGFSHLFFTLLGAFVAVSVLVGWLSVRRIGGVTGDVLGAASELCELVAWCVAACFLFG